MQRSPSATALSDASTQHEDEDLNLDDTQLDDSDRPAEPSALAAMPWDQEETMKTSEVFRKTSRPTTRPRKGNKHAPAPTISSGASPFAQPAPLMTYNYASNQTPAHNNFTPGTLRGRNNRQMTPQGGFSSVRRSRNTISDKSSPGNRSNYTNVFANGGQLGGFSSPSLMTDGGGRMKPLSRSSPFDGVPGPRSSQPNSKGEVTYPLVFLAPGGFISIMLRNNLVIETSVDRSIRVIKFGYFAAFMDHRGCSSSVVHPHARVLHQGDSVAGKFTSINDKMVIFGKPGVLFSMDHLREAYLISANHKSPSPVSIERLEFPKMAEDMTMMQFYRESQTGPQFMTMCREIIDEATYDRKADGNLVMHINGLTIRYSLTGDLHIDARPRHIKCSADGSIQVRTGFIDTNVQSHDMAFVKFGAKRVHISRSGMVASDGSACTSMDHFGRIIAST